MIERVAEFVRPKLSGIGQVSGYSTFIASKLAIPQTAAEWVWFVKEVVGLIGLTAGAALSIWALYDKWKNKRAERMRDRALD